MANSSNNRTFILEHPLCVFCGGTALSKTVEHCPPQSFFKNRVAPSGFTFPACDACNYGTSQQDLLFALMARFDPINGRSDSDGRVRRLFSGVNVQFPGLYDKMLLSPLEARRVNRSLGIVPLAGQTQQDVAPVRITQEMHDAVASVARKLGKGLFYKQTGRIFPAEGEIALHWFTNAELYKTGKVAVLECLEGVTGEVKEIARNSKSLEDQFGCKISFSDDSKLFVITALFGNALGLVIFGSTTPAKLSSHLERIKSSSKGTGYFSIL